MHRLVVLTMLVLACEARVMKSDPVFDALEGLVVTAGSPSDIDKFFVTRDWAPYTVHVEHELNARGHEVADVYTVRVTLD